MRKIVAILLVLVIAGSVLVIAWKNNTEKAVLREEAALSEKVTRLQAEKNQLNRRIAEAWKQYEVAKRGGNHCIVLFYDNMTPNLMDEIFPVVSGNTYKFQGVMTMYDLQMPGDAGCITWEDYNTLVDAGWDFAIGTGSLNLNGADSINVLRTYLAEYKAIFDANSIPFPITFCFGVGQYDSKYNSVLNEYGFKVIRHFGEEYDMLATNVEIDGMYLLGTAVMSAAPTTLKATLSEVKTKELSFSVTVRYITHNVEDETKDCSYARYNEMLSFIKNMNVMTATELYDYKTETLFEATKFLETFNEEMAAMEESVAAIEAEIAELTK